MAVVRRTLITACFLMEHYMIEQLIKELIAALNANTAAQGGAAAASTDAGAATTTKTTGKAGAKTKTTPPGPTREEMVASLTEVKEKFGAAEAKAIITKVGAAKMADIADDKIGTAFTLAKAKLEADAAAGDDDDDGI